MQDYRGRIKNKRSCKDRIAPQHTITGTDGKYMSTLTKLVTSIKTALLLEKHLAPELARTNIRRIILMTYVMVPVHIAHIVFFWTALSGGDSSPEAGIQLWRTAIIALHAGMLALILVNLPVTVRIQGRGLEHTPAGRSIPPAMAFLYLLFGAAVCVVDQLVTASINPYLVSSVAVALIVTMHPKYPAFFYSVIYLLFYFSLPLTQADSELLLSVRVNGISAAGIGFGIALITWRTNLITFMQNGLIDRQKEELKNKNDQLQHMVRTDMLTGLYNRVYFTEFVEMEIARTRRSGEESCLVFLDLDYFKKVNDQYGHPGGDLVLKWLSGVIRGQLRTTDILARFGGEEFAIMLPDTSLEGAGKAAEKIRRAVENCSFPGAMENLQITASFGVAALDKSDSASFNIAYREADKALYRAKELGRNRVEAAL